MKIFLLANLLQAIYMLVQSCTKVILTAPSAVSLTGFELAFFRSFYNLIASTFFLKCANETGALRDVLQDNESGKRSVLMVRCVAGTICFLTFVFAIKYLPLSIFFMVMNASPFLMAILTCLWLKELISLVEVICMVGAFGGICLVGMSK